MDRRDFLHVTALAPLALSAPPPPWDRLRRRLAGTLVLPGEAGYDSARRLYNPAYDRIRPGGVAYCAGAADVSACLAFARTYGVAVATRSGGHSYAGWSTGTGLVIDVSRMASVTYANGRATVGAGAKLIDVYDRLSRHGVSIPAGSCPTVGIGGLTLGGGIGVVSRKYGLTCDVLESVRVVTADGRLLTCDAEHHAGLYWACRGGGGGNFGVAVSFRFRTHEARDLTVFSLSWPWARAAAAVRAWQSWGPSAPDELWSSLHLSRSAGGLEVRLIGTYVGRGSVLERLLVPLVARIGRPSSRSVRTPAYLDAMRIMAGCPSLSVAECRRLPRETFAAKSHLAYRKLPAEGIRALVAGVARRGRHSVLMDALGGAIGRVDPAATAFPHRAALYSVQYYAEGTDRGWLRGIHGPMSRYFGDHAYVNYIDPDLGNWRSAYYGANARRLAEMKATYDPSRLFRISQGV
ncbi:FAD-binding oxidoreductase [Nonomuraea jiangxiensis]|uniref:FAD/FMN-containing dehydrogenase n=1 Tax=Nonomuraea jiangxiensis TaxID=633440 RepID=A0A1G8EZM5_9ACTN|nr:FAD-binding oxidoreductase [Nonomuraea jiangxiensis]SDH75310.1 FAD/FMN-containing dehydrogenase [Nonomuraea jiangxiensis]